MCVSGVGVNWPGYFWNSDEMEQKRSVKKRPTVGGLNQCDALKERNQPSRLAAYRGHQTALREATVVPSSDVRVLLGRAVLII